jgi:hypothetical protein
MQHHPLLVGVRRRRLDGTHVDANPGHREAALTQPVRDLVRQQGQLLRPHRRAYRDRQHARIQAVGTRPCGDARAHDTTPRIMGDGARAGQRGRDLTRGGEQLADVPESIVAS